MPGIFPRAEGLCTRLPIKIQLRRTPLASPPTLQVVDVDTQAPESAARTIPLVNGEIDVREAMEELVRKEHSDGKGISKKRMLVLSLSSPDVPTLDLVDLPGLVSAGLPDEPADLPEQTEALIGSFIDRYEHRDALEQRRFAGRLAAEHLP